MMVATLTNAAEYSKAQKMSEAEVCCHVKSVIKSKIDNVQFDSWIAPLALSVQGGILNFAATNQFSADFIKRTYLKIMESAASEFGYGVSVSVGGINTNTPMTSVNDNENKKFQINNSKPESGFAEIITSEENAFVLSACKKVASGRVSFSPLFIYGVSGCGKSALMHTLENCASGRVLMMTGNQFLAEFLRAMSEHAVFAFKDFVRNCDTFILDDVQELIGKRATCEEFMSFITDLIRGGKNVVLTANAAPSALTGFDRKMQSVFASGLSVEMVSPDVSTRRLMLIRGGVPRDIADAISPRIPADGHIVSGVIKKVAAWSELMGDTLSLEIVEKLLADVVCIQKTPLAMVRAMAAKMGVSFEDVSSSSRVRGIVRVRQMMFVALKSATKLSLSEIGRLVGGRDHATVLYGIAQVEKQQQTDLMMAAEIQQMIDECK